MVECVIKWEAKFHSKFKEANCRLRPSERNVGSRIKIDEEKLGNERNDNCKDETENAKNCISQMDSFVTLKIIFEWVIWFASNCLQKCVKDRERADCNEK